VVKAPAAQPKPAPAAQPAAKAPVVKAPAAQPQAPYEWQGPLQAYEWQGLPQGPEAPASVLQREKDKATADRLMDEVEAYLEAGNIEAARAKQAEVDAILDRGL
jgi:hypothetical protein